MEELGGEPRREDVTATAGGVEGVPDTEGVVGPEGPGVVQVGVAEQPAPLMEPEFVSGSVAPPPEPYRPASRRKLALLTAAAVVLGLLAGAGAGYKVQQDRKPTSLPRLIGPPPTQPAAPGPVPPTPNKKDDADAVFEANLLDVLLPTPKGAKQEYRRYISQAEIADDYSDGADGFSELSEDGFRRSVSVAWETGKGHDRRTEVRLTQFRDDVDTNTTRYVEESEFADGAHQSYGTSIPGTLSGEVLPSALPYTDPGYEDYYVGVGFARVGNIFVEVYVSDVHAVSDTDLMSVITKQLERM